MPCWDIFPKIIVEHCFIDETLFSQRLHQQPHIVRRSFRQSAIPHVQFVIQFVDVTTSHAQPFDGQLGIGHQQQRHHAIAHDDQRSSRPVVPAATREAAGRILRVVAPVRLEGGTIRMRSSTEPKLSSYFMGRHDVQRTRGSAPVCK